MGIIRRQCCTLWVKMCTSVHVICVCIEIFYGSIVSISSRDKQMILGIDTELDIQLVLFTSQVKVGLSLKLDEAA